MIEASKEKTCKNAKIYVGRSTTVHIRFYWLVPQYGVNIYCVLCKFKAKKENKSNQQRTLPGFINHSPLLTMSKRIMVVRTDIK